MARTAGAARARRERSENEQDARSIEGYVRDIVRRYFSTAPKRIEALGGGITNHVYAVDHPDGQFIVRMGATPAKVKEFLKEQWAIARAAEVGVPSAEVLQVGTEAAPLPYMIMRKVDGTEATHHPDRVAILREMGRLTRLIHGVRTSGFGHTFDWSNDLLSRNETWKDYLQDELKVGTRLDVLEEHELLDKAAMKRLRAIWREVEGWKKPPSLNHGDMRLKNVMVDDKGAVTAVIDWEFCSSNVAPYWDLSLTLHDLSIDAKQEYLAGYGLSAAEIREAAPVIKAINIVNYAHVIEAAIKDKDRDRIDHFRVRLSGALDLYAI